MSYNLTSKEYKEMKNLLVSVITFDRNGKRILTYSGLNYKKALEEVFRQQIQSNRCIIMPIGNFGIIDVKQDNFEGHLQWIEENKDRYKKWLWGVLFS